MNQEILTLNLSDLETILSKGHCACHFINPNKTRIILWKSQNDPDTYYLRIGIQKFTSYPLKDKNKALYWRFNCFEAVSNSTDPNPITKFHQQQHGKPTSATNSSEPSESTSH